MSDTKIKIAIGADHAGFEYKEILKDFLQDYEVKDFGTYSENSVDYPDFAHPVAAAVENGEFTYGILLCGSANGVAITANKHQHIRAGLCWENEVASLVRKHNNANVLCIPARFVSEELAKEITTTFLTTEFEGGRHQNRVEKISC
ncbi:ribose 5-phosphate isomerase B [Pedobacter sp. ISL-68]|jgi:ribose 5-phosphate isomerase B|uniref:Ribose 5-phosphate isomerase n=2 Tax=Pedobacter TaxID=84567 RepID=A0A0T5VS54_9SPHI|nr:MULTISPECIES: ribose 5-phosphate isomerase B [Pedobacter]KRT16699.1 ribose 5-phosphate isomerase [Pedobacter ginsenosidimutans]MBT2562229.1 ribose 5-phosphate isomerase B [Pedobacter sp. ISL-64]MBT2589000.1 ribose 5-phosphate isomerase B [Pedobacter sp. ISL-68]MDQ0637265.1 ribose 5-phosphate isomerase B [Pedobacter sp. W3I1]TBO39838.1 ribose 5-phosphate isomerase B [Pedobacter kyonggii]